MPNSARISENISACLTVSMPRSASRSRSSSSMSTGYPVLSATMPRIFSCTCSSLYAAATILSVSCSAVSAGCCGCEAACCRISSGFSTGMASSSGSALAGSAGAIFSFSVSALSSEGTAFRVLCSTVSCTFLIPLISSSQALWVASSAILSSQPSILSVRLMATWDPKPAAMRMAYLMGRLPPWDRSRSPSSGSGSRKLGIGGTFWCSSMRMEAASSMPTAMGCPVYPLVFDMTSLLASSPKALRRAAISAAALPPRAGV